MAQAEAVKKDPRSRRVVFLAHCLLNQNAKVSGIACFPGVFEPLVSILCREGAGIVQMPCPEVAHLGLARPLGTDTREQYDTPEYRETCRTIAAGVVEEIALYLQNGYFVTCILGVEGSPSCGAARVPRLDAAGKRVLMPGKGIFMEALGMELERANLSAVMIGVPESTEPRELEKALNEVVKSIRGSRPKRARKR